MIQVTTGVYHLTKQPELWLELKRQLRSAIAPGNTQPDVTELERVPLMEAVAKESLRAGCPIRGKNPRIVPAGGMVCGGVHIPQGVGCHPPSPPRKQAYSCTDTGILTPVRFLDLRFQRSVVLLHRSNCLQPARAVQARALDG